MILMSRNYFSSYSCNNNNNNNNTFANMMMVFFIIIIIFSSIQPTMQQGEEGTMTGNTYHVRGKIVMKEDATTRPADILQQCFYGIGLVNCEHRGDLPRLPPYPFHPKSKFVAGNNYCIECCDNNRLDYAFEETWSLYCALDDGDKKELEKLEVYDLQFKFARRETMEDEEMIVCDIPHQSIATSALTGYHLKIWVTEKSAGTAYYRGVTKCEVTSTEDESPGAKGTRSIFWENITIINANNANSMITIYQYIYSLLIVVVTIIVNM